MKIGLCIISLLLFCNIYNVKGQGTFQQIASLGSTNTNRQAATSFVVMNRIFVALGSNCFSSSYNDVWEYKTLTNTWVQKAPFPGNSRQLATSFVIDSFAYVIFGQHESDPDLKEVWKYSPTTDTWTQLPSFPGLARTGAFGFSLNGKGYIGGGRTSFAYFSDVWEFNPSTETWLQKSNFGWNTMTGAVCMVINNKAYAGLGMDENGGRGDFWVYDPNADHWTQVSNFSAGLCYGSASFSLCGNGYMVQSNTNKLWQYSPSSDTWSLVSTFSAPARHMMVAFSLTDGSGVHGYFGIGTEFISHHCSNEFMKFTPDTCNVVGVDNIESKGDIKVYPNPATTSFSIECNPNAEMQISVCDLVGRQIASAVNNHRSTIKIECSNWSNGMYLIKVVENSEVERIIKIYVSR